MKHVQLHSLLSVCTSFGFIEVGKVGNEKGLRYVEVFVSYLKSVWCGNTIFRIKNQACLFILHLSNFFSLKSDNSFIVFNDS